MIKVGVIRGGINPQYTNSLDTGGLVLSALRSKILNNKYQIFDILLDREGILHINGLPLHFEDLYKKVDVVWNALHGEFGADGKLVQKLEHFSIPYTGSGIFSSALAYNKKLTKDKFLQLGLKTPKHVIFPIFHPDFDGDMETYPTRKAQEVWRKMPAPWIVKPVLRGSTMGIHVCKTFPDLVNAFTVSLAQHTSVIVEELIEGKEASVFTIENFRNSNLYTTPPLEINRDIYVCPGRFSVVEKIELENIAKLIHKEFGMDHFSKSKFIVHPKKGVYTIGVEAFPELKNESEFHQALSAVGAGIEDFVYHMVNLALGRK